MSEGSIAEPSEAISQATHDVGEEITKEAAAAEIEPEPLVKEDNVRDFLSECSITLSA